MKNLSSLLAIACAILLYSVGVVGGALAQEVKDTYWNVHTQLLPLRLAPSSVGYKPEYSDLNHNGRRDALNLLLIMIFPYCGWTMIII